MKRLEYLVMCLEVTFFTDHENSVYIHNPYGRNPGISRQTEINLMRWEINSSSFQYIIEHILGKRNVWAGMLTRWAVKPPRAIKVIKTVHCEPLMCSPINEGEDPRLDWPTERYIMRSQSSSAEKPPTEFSNKSLGRRNEKGHIWITADDKLLKL